MCVCVFSSHSFWTSSSLDAPAGVTQEEGHTGFFIHLLSAVRAFIFLARRIQPFLSLVDCVNIGYKILSYTRYIIITNVLYFIALSSVKNFPQPNKKSASFYAKSYPYKTHVCMYY